MNGSGEKLVLLGKIVGVHGVRGELRLESYTEPRTQIFHYRPWLLRFAHGERSIDSCRGRAHGKGLVAELPGIANRDAAAALAGAEIWVKRSVLPAPKPGEYYWSDLEGLEVVNLEGVSLGQVSHLLATGANDVLVVRSAERERLIPFLIGRFVTAVNMDMGRLVVDWDAEF
ncbi:MAG: ribosome maturation factor RimM [Rhodanobacter sp.]|nr:ribosome maturation factor RimM [Rhodanobacter sp.]